MVKKLLLLLSALFIASCGGGSSDPDLNTNCDFSPSQIANGTAPGDLDNYWFCNTTSGIAVLEAFALYENNTGRFIEVDNLGGLLVEDFTWVSTGCRSIAYEAVSLIGVEGEATQLGGSLSSGVLSFTLTTPTEVSALSCDLIDATN